ncbi:glutamyl-tRNA reductase [Leptospira meyeri]|uniref:Glutamyl-tRNA reductase n=1 Tax=Leptospira meyeri TaxID=29508 RepID=A0A4R8MYN7_LEPME|nr:glutamyl-tRNA reductase [Leptospira meyeri]EKJ85644.1 glutamyl-tRNAGlu reductase, N-terminal-like domain protein [Leptospira meyeri serovar Hardjo str. Went 5]EMJ86005.1 glutamyl-tRNAGlu reductase, N-terminal-like domain protein [Leptospira meyeri serovar Semaranga str. Veldrot Semarang 173]MCW7489551.1 glutamyl-tRNA reductase [Leptospira meyeri]PJZ82293.1 glutamyl-tRNA reductase [Leptospira meyeri]PJZ97795.1 glutamyl-tRNA reductase [Leptospira meyeri]
MWSNLILLHSNDPVGNPLDDAGLEVWQTCQRNIAFGDRRLFPIAESERFYKGYEVFHGFEAYRFLLEVVSGLRSKLFGESEIQAQFRDRFREEKVNESTFALSLLRLRDQILEHTKQIRSKYLTGLGRQTYGSVAESYLQKHKSVTLLGTGKLATSILPYLISKDKEVRLIGRNQTKLNDLQKEFPITTHHWEDYQPGEEAIVIASSFLPFNWDSMIESSSFILDFRETTIKNHNYKNYIPLSQILSDLQETDEQIQSVKMDLQFFLTELTREREEEQIHIMNGWEDLLV